MQLAVRDLHQLLLVITDKATMLTTVKYYSQCMTGKEKFHTLIVGHTTKQTTNKSLCNMQI